MHPWIDPSTAPARRVVVGPLAGWVEELAGPTTPLRVLDLGCGDLLLARLVPDHVVVDGWDPSPASRAAARAAAPSATTVFDEPDQVPDASYDAVVLGSVLQYLADVDEVAGLLARAEAALRPDATVGLLVTDVVVDRRSRRRDATDLLAALTTALGPRAALRAVVATARHRTGPLLVLSDAEVAGAAARAGLHATPEPRNRSPLGARRSYRCTRPDGAVGPGSA